MNYTRVYIDHPNQLAVITRGQGNREYSSMSVPVERIPELIEGLLSAQVELGRPPLQETTWPHQILEISDDGEVQDSDEEEGL